MNFSLLQITALFLEVKVQARGHPWCRQTKKKKKEARKRARLEMLQLVGLICGY